MSKDTRILNERVATNLATGDFYYDLPEELIAQSPREIFITICLRN